MIIDEPHGLDVDPIDPDCFGRRGKAGDLNY